MTRAASRRAPTRPGRPCSSIRLWFGIPAYHQILTAALPGDPLTALPQHWQFWDAGFLFDVGDHANLDLAMEALSAGKRVGDRILVDPAPTFAGTRAAALPTMQDL